MKNLQTRTHTPRTLLTDLGAHGAAAIFCTGKGIGRFFRDLAHGICRVLRLIYRILTAPVRLHGKTAEAVHAEWKHSRGQALPKRAHSAVKMLGVLLLSEHGILVTLFRILAPLLCCAALFAIVRYGTAIDYAVDVTFCDTPLGLVASEDDYRAAQSLVIQRLSYANVNHAISYNHTLKLVQNTGKEPLMTAAQLADKMLRCSQIDLISGWGVYVNEDFCGVVDDPAPIRDALAAELSAYSDRLGGLIDCIYYGDTVRYVEGTYLAENRADADALARKLTASAETQRKHRVRAGETIYSIADDYLTAPETLRELNPELGDLPDADTEILVPVTEHYLPIVYRKTRDITSFIDYDTERIETMMLPAGTEKLLSEGTKGQTLNTVQITYTDGIESGRVILASHLIAAPINAQLGVGIYEAKPASAETVIAGSGKYSWPVNGGYISDRFGVNRGDHLHGGLDIAAPEGTNIYAADDGTVTFAGWSNSYGNYLIVEHEDGFETRYAHCTLLLASEGQKVTRGQLIARVGTTGNSTGNHLHFEVRIHGMVMDPTLYLRVNVDS